MEKFPGENGFPIRTSCQTDAQSHKRLAFSARQRFNPGYAEDHELHE